MRVALFGNRELAVRILERVAAKRDAGLRVVLNADDEGRDTDKGLSLAAAAKRLGVQAVRPPSGNAREARRLLARFRPHLLVSASAKSILRPGVLETASVDAINLHFSALPRHRGCLPVVWTLASGDEEAGVTLHRLTAGIDAGAILDQERFPISEEATAADVTAQCIARGVELFERYWENLSEGGRPLGREQGSDGATYHHFVFPYDRWLQWGAPAREVRRLLHALTHGGHWAARTRCRGREVELLGPAALDEAARNAGEARPGRVRHLGHSVEIVCGAGAVRVAECRVDGVTLHAAEALPEGEILESPEREIEAL